MILDQSNIEPHGVTVSPVTVMTSFSSSLSDELLQCNICLEVLTDPVTTSCGHNFCNICIKACWESGQLFLCPLCKEDFESKPELKINAAFKKVVDRFKVHQQPKKLQHQTKHFQQILCDVCSENKQRAVKSCLHCVTSFCETHLDHHKTAPRLTRHRLINPVENLEDYICRKHDKPLEMFCRDDQTCLCLFCTETVHKTHNAVPIEEESGYSKVRSFRRYFIIFIPFYLMELFTQKFIYSYHVIPTSVKQRAALFIPNLVNADL